MSLTRTIKQIASDRPDVWTTEDIAAAASRHFPRTAPKVVRDRVHKLLAYYRRNGWIETVTPATSQTPGRYLWLSHRKSVLTEKSLAEVPY